jgi:pyruvate dehydrogenase E1 component alpha subunit
MAVAPAAVRPERKPPTPSGDGKIERDRLRLMMLTRRLEERTYVEYTKPGQKIGGFCHLYSGQEAVSVGIGAVFDKSRDALINGYRCHGHSLALGMSPRAIIAELFGKATGCSKGKGGSMHLFDAQVGNHGGHGIVGGHIPVALGFGFAQKYKKTGGATICLFGDGAINQGTFNESMNMASLYKLPVVYAVENNGVAMGTQVERHSAERDLAKRGAGFNMPYYNVDGMDVDTVIAAVGEAFDRCRKGEGPTFLSINTYRYRGHSMSDPLKYRPKEEAEKWKARDPILTYGERLKANKLITDADIEQLQDAVNAEVDEAIKQADADPQPALEERFDDILAETYPYDGK